jgi:hypothetical protein
MTSIIHRYLYEHFIFVDGKIRSKSDYARNQELISYVYFDYTLSKIIEELTLIFALTKKQLKYYIKGWVRKQNRGFDFENYWNPPKPVFGKYFPMLRRVHARTISMDLARVEPMEGPRGIIMGWDHVVEQPEPVIISPEMAERYSRRVVNPNFYGTLNVNATPELLNQLRVEEPTEQQRLRRQRIIQLWENQMEFLNR